VAAQLTLTDLRFTLQRKRTRWLGAALLGAVTFVLIFTMLQQVRRGSANLGDTVQVLVATERIDAGQPLSDATTRLEARPRSQTPATALVQLPSGARSNSILSADEVITAPRITAAESGAVAALIPSGTMGVAIPMSGELGVEAGDQIAVYRAGFETRSSLVVASATVVAVGETGLIVAIPPAGVSDLLEGLVVNDLVPVLLPGTRTMN
jgi:hypothetical protein